MSYSGFGPWRRIALRLIHDDVPLSQVFFSTRRNKMCASYSLSLADAAERVSMNPGSLVVPCMALLNPKGTLRLLTHAVVLVSDGRRVRLFDPNGRYTSSLQYFIRGNVVSSDDVAKYLKELSGSSLPWSRSFQGVQSTIREKENTPFVPNRGYCMFLCRILLDYLTTFGARDGEDIFKLVRRFERFQCTKDTMGPIAKQILEDLWPDPSRY